MNAWRFLCGDDVNAASGLATDEALLGRYARGAEPADDATLRLYWYRAHAALVGRHQSAADEVDLQACAARGIEVSRRPTGGGAILMGPAQLAVALVTRATPDARPRQLLQSFADGLIAGFEGLGIGSAFRAKNDLEVAGRKIAGLGLYRDPDGGLLLHASVLVDLDVALMLRVLRIPAQKLEGKAVAAVAERLTTISEQLGQKLIANDVRKAFQVGFGRTFTAKLSPGELDESERAWRDHLIRSQYACADWIHRPSKRRDAGGSAVLKTPAGLLRMHVAVHGSSIKSVVIDGDFNELPPGIRRLESRLRWGRAERRPLTELTRECLAAADLGVSPDDVAAALWRAVEDALAADAAQPVRLTGSCYVRPTRPPITPPRPADDQRELV